LAASSHNLLRGFDVDVGRLPYFDVNIDPGKMSGSELRPVARARNSDSSPHASLPPAVALRMKENTTEPASDKRV
jgi:hypothetical protein